MTGFSIDPADGSIRIGEGVLLSAGQRQRDVERLADVRIVDTRDYGNGYAWIWIAGLSFDAYPATLSLCFHHKRLSEAAWSVDLPEAPSGSWPGREAIEAEVRFVRGVLARTIGYPERHDTKRYPWGEVWSGFDPKADIASHGLRYRMDRG